MSEFIAIFSGMEFEGNKTEGKLSLVLMPLMIPLPDVRRHTLQVACKYICTDRLVLCRQTGCVAAELSHLGVSLLYPGQFFIKLV